MDRRVFDVAIGDCIEIDYQEGFISWVEAAEIESWDHVQTKALVVTRVNDLVGWGDFNSLYEVRLFSGESKNFAVLE